MANKTPQLLKGFRDFGPDKMSARLFMFEKIRTAFGRFGFAPMETPALEYAETLTGKYGAEEKLIYKFQDNGGRNVALRYDLTVPLARFYATYRNDLPRPFKRYAIGPVWRAESPQKGRYREFYQCDVDAVGTSSPLSDAECIAATSAALTDLGIEGFTIKINNRKIIDGVLEVLKVPVEKRSEVVRLLDKLDKAAEQVVREELSELGLKKDQIKRLFGLLTPQAVDAESLRDNFSGLILESKTLAEGLGELSGVFDALLSMSVENLKLDLKLARGLDYYTGTVCEVALSQLPGFGSIAGGGRYDNLIGQLSGIKEIVPAVGMSIGLDRLLSALEELALVKYDLLSGALVFNLEKELLPAYLTMVSELRKSGLAAELYYQPEALDRQFRYAEKKKVNLAVIVGSEEIRAGEAKIKNLATREQVSVKAEKLVGEVFKLLQK